LISFFDHINKVSLPNFIDKFVHGKLEKEYQYDYFKEKPDEIITHISICYNIDNIISILKCIDKNREEITKLESISSSKSLLMTSFKRLYNEENLEKIMKFASETRYEYDSV